MARIAVCLVALLLFVSAANAQGSKNVVLKHVAEVEVTVVNEKGDKEIKRVDAAKTNVVPGNPVIFTTYYSNAGKEPATEVVITSPVPKDMVYKDGSAEGEGTIITFSADGGTTYDIPANLRVRDANGKERVASASDYTHIRWAVKGALNPGDKGSASFIAIVK